MNMETKDMYLRGTGWTLSVLCGAAGLYFLWPHIHVALLGIAFFYLGVRVFNFATFEEYKEQRMNLLLKLLK